MDTNGHTPLCEDYVSFEIAKLLKEKGFDGQCLGMYAKNGDLLKTNFKRITNSEKREFPIDAPTLQMAMKWLREVHYLYIEIKVSKNTFLWGFRVSLSNGSTSCLHANAFSNYEQACEAAIKYCLENLI